MLIWQKVPLKLQSPCAGEYSNSCLMLPIASFPSECCVFLCALLCYRDLTRLLSFDKQEVHSEVGKNISFIQRSNDLTSLCSSAGKVFSHFKGFLLYLEGSSTVLLLLNLYTLFFPPN